MGVFLSPLALLESHFVFFDTFREVAKRTGWIVAETSIKETDEDKSIKENDEDAVMSREEKYLKGIHFTTFEEGYYSRTT